MAHRFVFIIVFVRDSEIIIIRVRVMRLRVMHGESELLLIIYEAM